MHKIQLYILFLISSYISAQEQIFPDLVGDELLSELVNSYKPATVLNYSEAREYMFERLQLQQDSVEGIYTGFKIHLPQNVSSRVWTFENGINTEHIYPRSKGASDGNAFSDLHHLKPCKINVNSARLNHPYKEIDDDITKKWFRRGSFRFEIPIENINEYSELDSTVSSTGFITGDFEPRESVKGDIARSVFYFFTMYRSEAMSADPDYFESMRQDLCRWHILDSASMDEVRFSQLIAQVQDGKANPFVLDCSLALRSYCSDLNLQCVEQTVPVVEIGDKKQMKIFPNPSNGEITIISEVGLSQLSIFNTNGQKVYENNMMGSQSLSLDLNLPLGLYSILARDIKGELYTSRLMIQN